MPFFKDSTAMSIVKSMTDEKLEFSNENFSGRQSRTSPYLQQIVKQAYDGYFKSYYKKTT